MHPYHVPAWKLSPFSRLLLPLMAGIVLQWYLPFSLTFILGFIGFSCLLFFILNFIKLEWRFRLQHVQGLLIQLIILCFAMLLTWQQDIRHEQKWFGHFYNDSSYLLLRLDAPLTEKPRSFKAEAVVEAVINNDRTEIASGRIVVYFSKDSTTAELSYGDMFCMRKPVSPLKNSGNPGAFNYERYAAFQQIFHIIYLSGDEIILLKQKRVSNIRSIIFNSQQHIVSTLRKYLPADKNITGIAEALLIGYKEDLDKDLVQSYSNTGVVHIIAISGLHLGLIYAMLAWICNRLPFIKRSAVVKSLIILACLWFFSLLTGASASVLRSAVMFTCVVIGQNFFTRSHIFNSLAASAFILLCYDPYFLWDVGFQLSYLAVIGIIWLQQKIYRVFYIKNKMLDKLWSMAAVTLAAQLITFPICIYYFHQFPNLFLLTNLVAVPLSTIILFAEIFLLAFSWIKMIAVFTGKLISLLIGFMNFFIRQCDGFAFSRLDEIYADVSTTWVLYIFIAGICYWLIYKKRGMFRLAMLSLFTFSLLQAAAKVISYRQKKLIVYNIPRQSAIDFISGNQVSFYGDTVLKENGLLKNFHLKPARISMQVHETSQEPAGLVHHDHYWIFFGKKILMVDNPVSLDTVETTMQVDVLIISKNPKLTIAELTAATRPSLVVFDSSNSLWKIAKWKKECIALALPCFSIPEQGAFVLNID